MVGWNNPFDMRQATLVDLESSTLKNATKTNIANYRKNYSITCPRKSLDLLRKNIQKAINRDIENVIKKYVEKFVQPAVINIRNNCGKDSVNDEHIKELCRKMLDEAKEIYRSNTSKERSQHEERSLEMTNVGAKMDQNSQLGEKRKGSDTNSENIKPVKKPKTKPSQDCTVPKLPVKREAPMWDSERLLSNTLFIMGAKANKVLGYGQTRGRLYVRHPELVRYSGDQEDKEWLSSKNLMPPSGGKAYLMILSDIKELTESDEYKNSPNLQLNELKGFEIPEFMLNKIKMFMESVRTDKYSQIGLDFLDFMNQSLTPPSLLLDSSSTASDLLLFGESNSESIMSQQSDFLQLPEIIPSPDYSILSATLNQSPMDTVESLLSPNNILLSVSSAEDYSEPQMMMLDNTITENMLTNFLAQHFGDTTENFIF